MRSADTRRRWWRRGTSRAETDWLNSDEVAQPGAPEQPPTRPQPRMRGAEDDVRAWVKDLRGRFDAGSGATFDDRLDGVGIDWHKQDNDNHDAYLSALGVRIADSKQLVADSKAAVEQAEEDRGLAWQDYVATRLRLGGELPTGTPEPTGEDMADGPNYREPDLLPGRSRLEPLMWLFVLGAVAGDIAAFYGVLARLFRTEPIFVIALALGFAAAAIGICHFVGIGLQRRRSGERRRHDGLLWAKIVAWLALGCAAFVTRLHFSADVTEIAGSTSFGSAIPVADIDQDLLAALIFAGLYVVSGLLAMTVSFHTFNPAARAYRRALRNLKEAAQNLRSAQAQQAGQVEREKVVDKEQERALERRAAAYRRTEADVVSLKIFARHRMAAELGDAEALELLMKNAPTVDKYPDPGRIS